MERKQNHKKWLKKALSLLMLVFLSCSLFVPVFGASITDSFDDESLISQNNDITVAGSQAFISNRTDDEMETPFNSSDLAAHWMMNDVASSESPIFPSVITTTVGTLDSGDLDSVLTFEDSDTYDVSEINDTPGYTILFNFTDVEPLGAMSLNINYHYDGISAHVVDVDIWSNVDSEWQTIGNIVDGVAFGWVNSSIGDWRDCVCAAGIIRVMLNHTSPGNQNDDLFIDYIEISGDSHQFVLDSSEYLNHGTLNSTVGFDNYISFIIDSDDVDAALTDFPVMLYLSESSGINGTDLTAVFDEVGVNSLKIAVTISDMLTQCYVELDYWDSAAEEAWLFVRVPSISNITDTLLYLWFDNDKADNNSYVGVSGSAPAEAVWDSDHVVVDHLKDNPDVSHTMDSTANDNDGTKVGADEPITIIGVIDDAQDFDGNNDIDEVAASSSLNTSETELTISLWINVTSDYSATNKMAVTKRTGVDASSQYALSFGYGQYVYLYLWGAGGSNYIRANYQAAYQNLWLHVTATYDNDVGTIFINGVDRTDLDNFNGNMLRTAAPLQYGGSIAIANYIDAIMDEIRISNISRSPEWITANYETQRDHLITFGVERSSLPQYVNGTFNEALEFDGIQNYVEVEADSSLNLFYNLTIGTWIRRDDTANRDDLFVKRADADHLYRLNVWSDSKVYFYFGDGSSNDEAESVELIDDTAWHNIVVTFNGSAVIFYIDGVGETPQATAITFINSSTANLIIGAYDTSGSNTFDGLMDDSQFYNRCLSADEIWENYVHAKDEGNFFSTNLIASETGDRSFTSFSLTAVIANTESIHVSFSQDNTTFYDGGGVPGNWESLSNGVNTIGLSGLEWTGNFYYVANFSRNGIYDVTPELNDITLSYSTVTTEGAILGTAIIIALIIIVAISFVIVMALRKR